MSAVTLVDGGIERREKAGTSKKFRESTRRSKGFCSQIYYCDHSFLVRSNVGVSTHVVVTWSCLAHMISLVRIYIFGNISGGEFKLAATTIPTPPPPPPRHHLTALMIAGAYPGRRRRPNRKRCDRRSECLGWKWGAGGEVITAPDIQTCRSHLNFETVIPVLLHNHNWRQL